MRLGRIRGMGRIGIVAGLAALAVIGVACSTNGEAAPASNNVGGTGSATEVRAPSSVSPAGSGSAQVSGQVGQSGPAGIWVTGLGSIELTPDLALLNVGVETFGDSVAQAREQAATSMDAIVKTLKDMGIADRDIQTRFFNISPQYEYQEVVVSGRRQGKQVLVGYRVNNSASVKVRDMDAIGATIDAVAGAGGDAARIDGVSFTVEDTDPFMDDLREMAIADALAKAQDFADLTGVSLGRLAYITELGGASPVVQKVQAQSFALERAMAAPSPISAGELELTLSVQAAFGID